MYLVTVLLLMFVLPILSVTLDHFFFYPHASLLWLVGKWFVFWAGGVRLFSARLRQFFQPTFTVEQIFGIRSNDALPFVRELGAANFAVGTVAILSLFKPNFVMPMAIVAGLFYGIAGLRHATDKHRTWNQNLVMVTDLLVFLVLALYVAVSAAQS
jgi:hypothetical protein